MIGPGRLGVGAGPVEDSPVPLAPDGEFHFERTVAQPVVVNIVLEGLRLGRDIALDKRLHGPPGAVEQGLTGGQIGVAAKPLAQFLDPLFGGFAAGHDPHQVRAVHDRDTDVVEDQVQDVLVQLALLKQLDRRDAQPLAKDRRGVGRKGAGQGTADIHLVAEHRGPADQFITVKDRDEDQKIVDVGDRSAAQIRVVEQDDIAGVDRAVEAVHHLPDIRAELADDHPAVGVADHRKLVVLLPNDRRHGGTVQHRVHLVAVVLERALNNIEGDRIDLQVWNLSNFHIAHRAAPLVWLSCSARAIHDSV